MQGNSIDEPGLTNAPTAGESDSENKPFSGADTPLVLIHRTDSVDLIQVPISRTISIGRGADVDVRIAEASVSRIHAQLSIDSGRLVLEDLGGRNGTRVNGTVVRSARRSLSNGDVIGIGSVRMVVAGALRGAEKVPSETKPSRDSSVVVVDPATERLFKVARRLGTTTTTVLIVGETGAGKDVVASWIHAMSPRASVPLVRLTCSAVPESILESELFGHEKGAFTGADRKKLGYFEAASGGTLFLDEIGDMPLPAQARLLSVLETGTVTRLGSTRPVPVDVRVLCATHRDLRREIAQGQFRQDLYYRIAGFTVLVPPLRERPGDIEPLALAFISRIAASMGVSAPSLSNEALEALQKHPWPGNVRELRNAVEHAVVTVEEGVIQSAHLALSDSDSLAQSSGHRPWNRLFPEEKERILAALDSEGGNQVRASQRLGMSRRMLLYRMEKYGITRSR